MRKPYFPIVKDAPAPLCLTVKRQVRFEEVDSMGIVWHGCYPSYFEDGRVALGRRYGISYSDFIREQVPVPVRQLQIDYHRPLRFEEEFEIKTTLHWSDAARINFEYEIGVPGTGTYSASEKVPVPFSGAGGQAPFPRAEKEPVPARNQLVCTGCTVQLMLDRDLNILLSPPPFFTAFLKRWKQGELA
jgi:acyl-CoA thioester hydrolase